KLTRALRCLQRGAKFAAANLDVTYPAEDGDMPGSAVVAAAIQAMAGREPHIMIAKPKPDLLLMAAQRMGVPPERCRVVGDSLRSEGPAAQAAGVRCLVVLTGGVAAADLAAAPARPDYVAPAAADVPVRFGLWRRRYRTGASGAPRRAVPAVGSARRD